MIIICICIGSPYFYGCNHSRCDSKPESTIIIYAPQLWGKPKSAPYANMCFIIIQQTSFMHRSCGVNPNPRLTQICVFSDASAVSVLAADLFLCYRFVTYLHPSFDGDDIGFWICPPRMTAFCLIRAAKNNYIKYKYSNKQNIKR